MEGKGFLNVEANVYQRNDPNKPGHVIVDIDVDKKLKTKVHRIVITGNNVLSFNKINKVMKKQTTTTGEISSVPRSLLKKNMRKIKLQLLKI